MKYFPLLSNGTYRTREVQNLLETPRQVDGFDVVAAGTSWAAMREIRRIMVDKKELNWPTPNRVDF